MADLESSKEVKIETSNHELDCEDKTKNSKEDDKEGVKSEAERNTEVMMDKTEDHNKEGGSGSDGGVKEEKNTEVKEEDDELPIMESKKHLYTSDPEESGSIYSNAEVCVDPLMVQTLSDGILEKFLPPLQKAKATIEQIKSSQDVLIETVQQETAKFSECSAMGELEKTMSKAKQYHSKLLKLKREMDGLHEKSARLKRRALKLQQHKQKEQLTRAHNLEKEMEKERMLTARVATTPNS